MKKKKNNITKEVFIMLIILTLIMLIMAVGLYDLIPANVNLPESIHYNANSETTSVIQEIEYSNNGNLITDTKKQEEIVTSLKSYSIEAGDLTVYGQKNLYNSGNSNPFDYATENTSETSDENTTAQTNTTSQNTNTTTTQTNTNINTVNAGTNTVNTAPTSGTSTGTFFENSASK